MTWKVVLFTMLLVSVGFSVAAPSAVAQGENLSDFMKLKEGLRNAICDEAALSRAPSLESLRSSKAAIPGSPKAEELFELEVLAREADLIGFLLGDSVTRIGSDWLSWRVSKAPKAERAASPEQARRSLAEDVCLALVTPNRLPALLREQPSRFLRARPRLSADRELKRPLAGNINLLVQDRESRFGRIGGGWWIAGWVEPYEVQAARAGAREYRRLTHPVTHLTRMVVLNGAHGPLGYFHPSTDGQAVDFDVLRSGKQASGSRAQMLEWFKGKIESEAVQAIAEHPEKASEIRALQEAVRGRLGAIALEERGGKVSAARTARLEQEVRSALDKEFRSELAAARVNGHPVAFSLFVPDERCEKIRKDFGASLARIVQKR